MSLHEKRSINKISFKNARDKTSQLFFILFFSRFKRFLSVLVFQEVGNKDIHLWIQNSYNVQIQTIPRSGEIKKSEGRGKSSEARGQKNAEKSRQ